ncbi:MAG: RtcB family protein [Halobacteriaceae archaeon]
MRPLEDVEPDDTVFVHPFEGLPDERPPEFVVLDADDFADEDPQLVAALEERDLLPLRSTDEALHRLLKLAGHHTGDGSFSGTQSWFYGRPEDLADIRADIEALGFTPSRVYERQRTHEIDGSAFERREYSVRSTSNAFQQLLRRLGAPAGPKVASDFGVPDYLDRLADWQIALYLSAFFGAEMSAPATVAPRNFQAPAVSQSREAAQREALETFMRDLMALLDRLNVEANRLEVVDTARDDRVRLRFGISTAERNLIRFFTRLGYRYNRRKQREGLLAAQYLKRKEAHVAERARIAREARTMADGGAAVSEVKDAFESVNDRFVERSVYDEREGRPRPSAEFPSFQEFQESTTVQGMAVSATVAEITERGEKPVFDIGVTHDAHNFVANGFVVSNCGVRLVKTELTYADLQGREEELVDALFEAIPSGLGAGGVVQDTRATVEDVLDRGMEWAREEGYAVEDDLEHCEDEGVRPEADPSVVSQKAKDRGRQQLGSLGSGNHFLEVQRVTDVYRDDVGAAYGLEPDQVVVLIHCGSRGLGHQVCTDYLRQIEQRHGDLLERLPDRELAAAPAGSALADEYYRAMCAAINFAWVNRQLITYQTRQVFGEVFDSHWSDLGMDLLYDVAHNIAKRETHEVDGRDRELFVHRKGATRAFPAGHPDVPAAYRDVGQPIIIPGSMGAGSYVLRGGDRSLDTSFGSTAHGAGRVMSRTQAKQKFWGGDVREELREQQHVYVKAQSGATIAEEAPGVYKDVDEVVRVSDALGIGDRVARTYPVCNIKG